MNSEALIETKCLFCADSKDRVLFPRRLDDSSFTGYAFSARRNRPKQHYRIVACRSCGLVRSNPILNESSINQLYADSGFLFGDEAGFAAKTYGDLLQSHIARDMNTKRPQSLLEIGCSTGFFLEKALQAGIPFVQGFEPSRECCEKAAESIRELIINDVFNPGLLDGRKFDIISGFHVIDHLSDPLALLTSAVSQLTSGGHLLLVCHDVEALSARILGDMSPIFDVEHIYLFSQKTIRLLMERAGLKTIHVGTLANTYPLGYWMRMAPVLRRAVNLVPGAVRKIPVRMKAGNLYAWGRKD